MDGHGQIPEGALPTSEEERVAEVAFEAAEEALHPHSSASEALVQTQIEALHKRDQQMAIGFLVLMLIALPFVIFAVWSVLPNDTAKVVVILAGVVLAIYNGASISMLLRNYRRDRDFIYRPDVAHLNELRAARRARQGASS